MGTGTSTASVRQQVLGAIEGATGKPATKKQQGLVDKSLAKTKGKKGRSASALNAVIRGSGSRTKAALQAAWR